MNELVYCKDGVNHQFLLEEVLQKKPKPKKYQCPRCKEELIK